MKKNVSVLFGALFLLAIGVAVAQVSVDKITGTWKLNVSKSKLVGESGGELNMIRKTGPNSFVLEITASGDKKGTRSFSHICDGKQHAEIKPAETCDPQTLTITPVSITGTGIVFAADGKTYTVTRHRRDKDGKEIEEALLFERQ